MKRISIGFLMLLVILSNPPRSESQVHAGSYQLSPSFGLLWTDLSEKGFALKERSELLGMNASWNITRRFSAEGSFHWSQTENKDSRAPRGSNLILIDGGLVVHLTKWRFVPYARGGIGYISSFSDITGQAPSEPYYTFGGGVKLLVTEMGGIRFDLRDIVFSQDQDNGSGSTLHNLIGTAAVVFQFGGFPSTDTDADGVSDKKDKCPDTPERARVDDKGCVLDSDGDGVSDGLDKCPGTNVDVEVDTSGCPIDSDRDGVSDIRDECPETVFGARVELTGCPRDTDGDGVYDGLDKCPDTPSGTAVDEEGCKFRKKEQGELIQEPVSDSADTSVSR